MSGSSDVTDFTKVMAKITQNHLITSMHGSNDTENIMAASSKPTIAVGMNQIMTQSHDSIHRLVKDFS